ncbi:MAG: T9SS type A sorting domain-containing protein [Chitinophagales bacterium]
MQKQVLLLLFACATLAARAQYPLVSIHDIQYKDDAALAADDDVSAYDGDTVRIQGIVTFDPCEYGLSSTGSRMGTFLQDPDGGPWNGIHVLIDYPVIGWPDLSSLNDATHFVDNFQVGNIVECTGIINAFDQNTQMVLLPIETSIIGFASMPDPIETTIDQFMVSDGAGGQEINTLDGEQYEGSYVQFNNVYVVDVEPSGLRWFWYLQDDVGNKIQIRDLSGWFRNDEYDDECTIWAGGDPGETGTMDIFEPPTIGTYLSYVRGVIVEFTVGTEYGLAPLELSYIGPALALPPVITDITRTPVVANATEDVTISANITDLDGTVATATLYYSYGIGATDWTAVTMNNTGGDSWAGNIPGPGLDGEYVNYYIEAVDNEGNPIETPTPGSPNTYVVYNGGLTAIYQIQNTPFSNGNSVWANDSIPSMSIEAVVTATTQTYDLGIVCVQEGSGPYEGIFIKSVPGDGTNALFRGDMIEITSAKVIEEFGVTKLTNMHFNLISQMNDLPDFVTGLDPESVDAKVYDQTEPYEGMLVRFDNQVVTSNNADAPGGAFGEWRVNSTYTAEEGMRCDDYSYDLDFDFGTDSLTLEQELSYIQGVMYYSFSNWKLIPRDRNDIDGYALAYPNNIVAFNFTSPAATGVIDQAAHTITVNVPEGTDVTALVPNIDITGQYVDPASGAAMDFSSDQTYTCYSPVSYTPNAYTVHVGFQVPVQAIDLSEMQVFPNPVSDDLTVEFSAQSEGQISLELNDLEGRNVLSFSDLCNVGKNIFTIDLRAVSNGLYLLQIRSENESSIQKIVVSK